MVAHVELTGDQVDELFDAQPSPAEPIIYK
jgi:hypothetical protein